LPKVGDALKRIAPSLEPQVLVVSGDLTQRAKAEQFAEARQYVDSLLPDIPRLIVPGNHDVPLYRVAERMKTPHALYRKYINVELNHVLSVDGAVLVGLDSTAPRSAVTNGRISTSQLEFCADAFDQADEVDARIVVAHHHFAPAPDYEHDQTMPKSRRALTRFNELNVDLILGGHLHRAYIGNSLDLLPGRTRSHQGIIIVQCGTSTSRRGRGRERERNSFNVIFLTPTLVHITHYMYFDDSDGFEPISRHLFPRRGSRLTEQDDRL
jgi:3',5'-cyclic AMP phosphodiesterase CpdA